MTKPLLLLLKALPAGERWITVHPPGHEEGQPLLIKEQSDGSAKVIGGAGGSMNHLRLKNVKSVESYKEEAKQREEVRKTEKKRQQQEDKKRGLTKAKAQAREALSDQQRIKRKAYVEQVAQSLGWKPEDTRFPEEKYANVDPKVRAKAEAQHERKVFQAARTAIEGQRQRIVHDADVRAEAGLGEVPLVAPSPDQLTVQDLDPVQTTTKGFGYSTDYGKRAEAAGLSEDELQQEAAAAKPPADPDKERSKTERKEKGKQIAEELEKLRDPPPELPPAATVDAKKARDLLKLDKEMRAFEATARKRKKQIDESTEHIEPKAYLIDDASDGSGVSDADIERDIETDLRTVRTRGFLSDVDAFTKEHGSVGRHIGVGAYNSINSVALATGGASLVDRSVVDVLGVAGASQVLARRLHTDLTPAEMDELRTAMGTYHVQHYMEGQQESLRRARELQEQAHEIEIGAAANGSDLAAAQELNASRRDLIQSAQEILGTAYGEMEANAALVRALKEKPVKKIDVSLGKTSIEDAIRQARAIGLDRGEYQVEKIGPNTFLTVHEGGLDKLAKPVSREDLARTRGALDIIEGRADQAGWLPGGVADRPDMAMNVPPGVAPRLSKPFPLNPSNMKQAIEDYIGGRTADGDSPADIMADLLSETAQQRAGDRAAFQASLREVAPIYDADGKMIRAESHQGEFEKMADSYVAKLGHDVQPLHRQQFAVDKNAVDALHRALAEHPDGIVAFKPVADLTASDQGALRAVFAREYGKSDPAAQELGDELAKLDTSEPEKEVEDMFGRGINPAWRDWQTKRNDVAEKVNKATMTWQKYLDVMGSPSNAYAAMQDVVRSDVLKSFSETHNKLNPKQPLRIGKTVISNDLNHLDALDPEARERRAKEHRARVDSLRNRVNGAYASGSVSDKVDAARAAEEAQAQAQMGLFGSSELASDDGGQGGEPVKTPPEIGERYTIGHAAERQIAGMMPIVGANFKPGQKTELWKPDMSGAYVGRQRAVKLIQHNRRIMLGLGVGSGKTSISLAGYTHLHEQGQAKRGMFVVPSIVQGQFHGEALTLLQPGKYNWHCNPGASQEERIKAYKDPSVNFNVVTHQAFRDDMLHLAAKREGVEPAAIAETIGGMKPEERASYMRDLMHAEGIDHDYMAVDEGHGLLNRAGKENSHLANVLDGVADGMGTYVNMTADPVKNDASEAFDVLSKMDRARYNDRAAFLRKYGVNTAAAQDGLRREMARHFYTGKIDPGVKADMQQIPVQLSPEQHAGLAKLDDAYAKARLARMQGKPDLESMRTLSPNSFKDVPEEQHEAVATDLQNAIGVIRDSAVHHVINGGAKTDALAKYAGDRKGKPGVVFARRRERVDEIAARLGKEGHRVVTLTGSDSAKDKDRKKREFKDGKHDVMVCSDAGAVGANLQTGQWLAQYDTPLTAMLHAQRNGRIHRIGQKNNVELADFVADHPEERKWRKRLENKYELRDIMTSPLEGLDEHGIAGVLNQIRSGKHQAAQPVHMTASAEEIAAATPASEPDNQASLF